MVAGGEPIRPQSSALARGVHVAIGTPGRLLDHLKRGAVDTSGVATVILDEADRMLDMGFHEEMESILAALPRPRQTAFFSATFLDSIEAMSRAHQRDAVRVTIGERTQPAPDIRGRFVVVQGMLTSWSSFAAGLSFAAVLTSIGSVWTAENE